MGHLEILLAIFAMKFLIVFLLFGLGLVTATSFLPNSFNDDVQLYDDQEEFNEVFLGADEGDDLARNLRERFEEILEKIKDAIENRKLIGGNVVAKFREIYNQMKEKSIPFGDKAKELLEQLKEKATGIWKRILDKINPSKRSIEARGTGAENLRDRMQEMLEKLRESIRDRKLPGRGFISKLRQLRDEMRNRNVPLGGKLKEMIDKLKENSNGVWRRILDRIGRRGPERVEEFDADEGDDLARNLRERFEEILEKIKDAIENHKLTGVDVVNKLREIYNQMKEKSIPFGDKAKELLEQLKEKATGIWKRILDKINPSKRSIEARGTGAENLRDRMQELLEKLRESFRDRKLPGKGFISKLRQVRDEMRQKNVPLGGKLKEMIDKLKENANGVWRRILDRIGQRGPERVEEFDADEDPKTELGKILKKHFEEILEKLQDIVDNGKTYKDDLLEKAKEIAQKLKDMKVDIGDHARDILKQLKEKAKDYWKKILDKFSFDSETNAQVFMEEPKTELSKILRKHFEEILEKLKDIIDNGKTYKDDLVEKAKEIARKLKDMNVDIGDHARDVFKQLKEKAKDYWKKILDKLNLDCEINSQVFMEEPQEAKHLRERLNRILDIVDDGFRTRTTIGGRYLAHLEDVWNEMKEKNINPGDKAIILIKDLKGRTNGEWKALLYKLLPDY